MKKIKPRAGTLSFCRLLLYGGISTFIMGALTGGFFGDAPKVIAGMFGSEWPGLPHLFSPVENSTEVLYGQSWFKEELLGLSFTISPFSFFQTNSLGAEVLYSTARDFIAAGADGAEVYDLYSGTGTIAQVIAPAAKHVTGVEIIEEAVEAAKENAKLNGLDNCDFIAGDVLKVLDDISEKPDYIILDPPRDGIHPKALDKIIDYGVDSLVYISCKPTSLARDLEVFLARGYKVTRLACVDMFPGTYHVETVALLSKMI